MIVNIYFPMTCNVLTPGHIQCIDYLNERGHLTVGLLTAKALKGYKKEAMPFADRKFILEAFNCIVVPQDSLDPSVNLKKYKIDVIASGDGWEKEELQAIKKLGVKVINIKLKGEKVKKYSSSKILKQ